MTFERVDCWCDILNSRNVCNGDVDAELACLIVSIAYFKRNCGVVSICDDCQVTHAWDHFPQYFEPLVEQITDWVDSPVTLPPGRARVATKPLPTGPAPAQKQSE